MDEQTLEDKCEHLMNVVVESRKQFGKMCTDYQQKTSMVENKILNLKMKSIKNCRFKPENSIPDIDVDEMNKELDEFTYEILTTQRRVEELRRNVTDVQSVVMQLKSDAIGKKMQKQITAVSLLTEAKNKMLPPMISSVSTSQFNH